MGLKYEAIQSIASAEAASAIQAVSWLKRARFHVTHVGGGGDYELDSPTPEQYWEHPISLGPTGTVVYIVANVITLASGGGVTSLQFTPGMSGMYGPFGSFALDCVNGWGPATPATNQFNIDISAVAVPAYYGGGGTLDGKTFILQVDGGAPQTVTFSAPADETAVINQINAQTTGVTASLYTATPPTAYLVITSDTTGSGSKLLFTSGGGGTAFSLFHSYPPQQTPNYGNDNVPTLIQESQIIQFALPGLGNSILGFHASSDVPMNTITAFEAYLDLLYIDPTLVPLGP